MKISISTILGILFLSACQQGPGSDKTANATPIDSFESALPHGKALPDENLSDEEKFKLANASGRQAIEIEVDSLLDIVHNDTSGLNIYNFWNLKCEECLQVISYLESIKQEPESTSKLNLTHINTDQFNQEQVNSTIREYGIVSKVFQIKLKNSKINYAAFQSNWNGELPAILIINQEEGLQLFYQRTFTIEELQALLLPLMI